MDSEQKKEYGLQTLFYETLRAVDCSGRREGEAGGGEDVGGYCLKLETEL